MYPDGLALDFAKSILFLDRKVQVLSTIQYKSITPGRPTPNGL